MSDFVVTEKAMRPASDERRCFYCHQPIGGVHDDDCVLVCRKVYVRMEVIYPVEVPAFWDKDMVEFHRNESSWCKSNAVDELHELFCQPPIRSLRDMLENPDAQCMCGSATFEYVEDVDGEVYLKEDR